MKAGLAASAGALALALAFPAAASAVPQAMSANGITYVSGGIGADEAAAMKAEAKHYPLSMVFSAGKDNEYLSGVDVTIKNHSGKVVFDHASDGPILLIKLPAGNYKIEASRDGKPEWRKVQVPAKGGRQVAFHWTDTSTKS